MADLEHRFQAFTDALFKNGTGAFFASEAFNVKLGGGGPKTTSRIDFGDLFKAADSGSKADISGVMLGGFEGRFLGDGAKDVNGAITHAFEGSGSSVGGEVSIASAGVGEGFAKFGTAGHGLSYEFDGMNALAASGSKFTASLGTVDTWDFNWM